MKLISFLEGIGAFCSKNIFNNGFYSNSHLSLSLSLSLFQSIAVQGKNAYAMQHMPSNDKVQYEEDCIRYTVYRT